MRKANTAKRILATLFVIILLAGLVPITAAAATAYAGQMVPGEYEIDSADDLALLATVVNNAGYSYEASTFTLINDIDMNGVVWTPIGDMSNSFAGVFDGSGNTISNLSCSGTYCVGLFGHIAGTSTTSPAEIKNLELKNVSMAGSMAIGGICGYATDTQNCFFSNCTVSGTLTGTSSWVGGIVGYLDTVANSAHGKSNINNCYVNADITCTSGGYVGGLCGRAFNNISVSNCYATGTINAGTYTGGGLLGDHGSADGTVIENSYALQSSIIGSATYSGRITGSETSTTMTISNCYAWDGMTVNGNAVSSADATSTDGADLTSTAALKGSTYSALGWDGGIWTLTDNDKLPYITNFGPVDTSLYTYLSATDTTAPTLSSTSADGLSASGATIHFTSDEAGTYYYVVYPAADAAPDAATVKAGTSGAAIAGANSFSVTGLSASADYTVYVVVEDGAGNTSAIADIDFTTSAATDTTAPTLSSTSADGLSASGATIHFASDEAGTYYYVVYPAADAAPDAVTVKGGTSGAAIAGANSFGVTGLSASTDYTVYVVVEDGAGNTSDIADIDFTTSAAADTTAPTLSSTSADGLSASGATIHFTSDEAGTYYYVVYPAADAAPDAATVKGGTSGAAIAGANSFSVTGLSASTDYTVYVVVEDGAGNTSAIADIDFTTSAATDTTAPTLSSTSADGLSASGATIHFTSDEAGTYYYVVYPAADAAPDAATIKGGTSGAAIAGANSFGVTGLSASTDYTVYVVVEDGAGNTSAIADIDFTTSAAAATAYAGQMVPGDYEITSADQLDMLAAIVNGPGYNYEGSTFTLLNDIDMNGRSWTPIGDMSNSFAGVFDGSGNTISNLSCSGTYCVGLFGHIAGTSTTSPAEIKNLELKNVSMAGSMAIGGICGYATDTQNCFFSNCTVSGTVSGDNAVGGIVGYLDTVASSSHGKSNINNCYVNADITGTNGYVGGLCGRSFNNISISNCYATGTINAGVKTGGGLLGDHGSADGTVIENSFALQSSIIGDATYLGRITGSETSTAMTISNCYAWDGMTVNGSAVSSADATSTDGADLTSTAALNGSTYSALGWDGGIWTLTDNDKLPYITNFGPVDTSLYTYLSAADTTAPTLSSTSADSLSASGATIHFTSDEAGTYYYVVYPAADAAPDAATIKGGTSGAAIAGANSFSVTGLSASTDYTVYVVVEDGAGNTSAIATVTFTTTAAAVGGGGGGGGTTSTDTGTSNTISPSSTATNGSASVQVSSGDLSGAIEYAKENNSGSIIISPEITGSVTDISLDLPGSSLSEIASQTNAELVLDTPVGSLTIPNDALDSITSQASGDTVTMSLETVGTNSLTPAQQEAVGDSPVYDISIVSGGENISSFGGESITVSLPYTLQPGEDPAGVTVWYLNDAGELKEMACTYDAATGTVSFTTDHLSYYVIAYDELAAWENPYADVRAADWYYDAVAFVSANELFTGTGAASFGPDTAMTRAMLVTVLYRLDGEPAVSGTNGFTDVASGQWYTNAVIWASENGIVSGYGGSLFGTNDFVTREQMAAILYNYASYKGYDISASAVLTGFDDAGDISAWAGTAMRWANAEGLITGVTSTTLSPSGSATRAQVAMILMRLVQNIAG